MLEDLDSFMEQERVDALLAMGNAFDVPDIYWLTGFRSTDSVIVFHNHGDESIVATSHNTLGRVEKESFIKETYDLTDFYLKMFAEGKRMYENPEIYLAKMLKDLFTGETIGVPDHIPAQVLVALQQIGYDVKVLPSLFKEARATKSAREIKMIKNAGIATMEAISKLVDTIKDTEIGNNKILLHKGVPLTVGTLKLNLEHFLLDQSAEVAEDTIIAVGKKAFDWHYLGKQDDKLKAEIPIIVDVFPRLKQDRFVADVTRTVVRGTPSKTIRDMFDAVYDTQPAILEKLKHGVNIDESNLACFNALERHGFKSARFNHGTVDGMTHGLGHGIGLQVHENPSFYDRAATFQEGHVVAIEPGMYLKSVGGVRYENDYVITKGKPKRLTLGMDEPLYL